MDVRAFGGKGDVHRRNGTPCAGLHVRPDKQGTSVAEDRHKAVAVKAAENSAARWSLENGTKWTEEVTRATILPLTCTGPKERI